MSLLLQRFLSELSRIQMFRKRSLSKPTCTNVGFARKGLQWHRSRKISSKELSQNGLVWGYSTRSNVVSAKGSLRTLTKTQMFRKRSLWRSTCANVGSTRKGWQWHRSRKMYSKELSRNGFVGHSTCSNVVSAKVSLGTLTETQMFRKCSLWKSTCTNVGFARKGLQWHRSRKISSKELS